MSFRFPKLALPSLLAVMLAGGAQAATITYTGNVEAEDGRIVVQFNNVQTIAAFSVSLGASADFGCMIASPPVPPGESGFCSTNVVQGFLAITGGYQSGVQRFGISFDNDPTTTFRENQFQNGFAVVTPDKNTVEITARIFAFSSTQADFPVTVSLLMSLNDPRLGPPTFLVGRQVTDDSQIPLPAALPLLAAGLLGLGTAARWRKG